MSRRQLPLDDARWLPIDRAHALLVRRTGDRHLAALDLTKKLMSGAVRCMVRDCITGKSERLPEKECAEIKLDSWPDGLVVAPRKLSSEAVQFCQFYVWEPDLKKIFANGDIATTARDQSSNFQQNPETPVRTEQPRSSVSGGNRGRKATHDWVPIRIEIMRRIVETLPKGPGNRKQLVEEVRQWYAKTHDKTPGSSTVSEKVREIETALLALLR